MPRLRLGVALLIPPPLDCEIDGLRLAVGDPALPRIPAHCTLVPPVNVREDRLADALRVLRSAAAATRPFTVDLGPPATFLPDTPVLHLPVGGDGLSALQSLRDRVFVEPLERTLTWPFVPHVTLADELEPARIEAALVALASYRRSVTFERVHLLQEGPSRKWTPIADAAFEAPAVVGRGGIELELAVTDALDAEAMSFMEREWEAFDVAEFGEIVGEGNFAITARRGDEIVGVLRGRCRAGVGYVQDLMVATTHRGEGIGSRLLAQFESIAVERGCRRLALRTIAGSRAEGFYRGRGWVEEGRRSQWIFDRASVDFRRDL